MVTIVDENTGDEVKLSKATEEARQKAFDNLAKKAILVNLTRKTIATFPFDVTFSKDVCAKFDVKNDSLIQIRKFIIDPRHTQKLRSLINDALLMVFNHTRPWDNMGFRLLPMELYDEFTESFGGIKDEFEEAVQEFETNYDSYIQEAKDALGKAFNKNNYPDKSQLKSIFNLEINTDNLPDIEDVRLNLTADDLLEMEKNVSEAVTADLNDVRNILMSRMGEYETLLAAGCSADILDRIQADVSLLEKANGNADSTVEIKLASIRELLKNAGVTETKEKTLETEEVTEDSMLLADDDDMDGLDDFDLA